MNIYNVSFLHRSWIGYPANYMAKDVIRVKAASKKEAKQLGITRFKKKLGLKRFYKKSFKIEVWRNYGKEIRETSR